MEREVKLVVYPDARLTTKSTDVEVVNDEVRRNVDDMIKAMQFFGGIGLAGVQIGYMKNVFVMEYDIALEKMERAGKDVSKYTKINKPLVVINPKITVLSDRKHVLEEGCLSLPGIEVPVERPTDVRIEFLDYDGNPQVLESELELVSACFQHEMDHNSGELIINKVSRLKRDMVVKKMMKYINSHDLVLGFDPDKAHEHSCSAGCEH